MRAWPRAPLAESAQPVPLGLPRSPGAVVRPDMEGTEEPEPSELFSDLGTLLVEGRMAGGQRGFHEGPHCVLVYPYRQNKHVCDAGSIVCQREGELRRYMYLLWRNNIPMSVEVLLCPPCVHGQSRAMAVDAAPGPGYLLLEQWTVHMETAVRCHRSSVGAHALLQAVYSYLHFSELSAWLSRSGGARPRNVMYRITVPGDAFGTRFAGGAPQLHTFPTAYLAKDRTLVQVSVRARPRCDAVPTIPCDACQGRRRGGAGGSEDDLRRSIIKSRLQGALSDSRDSLLGDSLLDPPRSLHKYPKRYQSPSRSGSPSLETPEHLMFGSRDSSAERRARTPCSRLDPLVTPLGSTRAVFPPDPLRRERTASKERRRSGERRDEERAPSSENATSAEDAPSMEEWQRTEEWRGQEEEADSQAEGQRRTLDSPRADLPQAREGERPRRRTPQRSRSDGAGLFLLTSEEKLQVVAVLRHSALPGGRPAASARQPTPPDNPLLSAIERAGQADARTERVRTSRFVARGATVADRRDHAERGRERTTSATCQQVASGAGERVTNGTSERASNGTCQKISSDTCERTAKGICERDARDTGKRAPCVARERGAGGTGRGVTNGTAERPVDDVGGPTTNGSAALNQKGSRAPKSPNLLKRLFKKDEPQDAVEEQPKETAVPSPASRAAFRRSLDSATSAVFSQKTGLPLSSSPAPLRRGNAFHFDAALTKVKTFSSALNELTADAESESAEPERRPLSASCPAGVVSSLLGSFEESVLNGRLGPVSTVEGFSADIGASGSFHPKHVRLPVTVFFYSLCDNEKIASPYMGLVNLGRKGYHVPKKGTLQVTLFNPHGTVVKMFVVIMT
ncbi:protein FAM214A-like [Pollicipes pollicipes]|uniref:protein FAM214A-like n=1 Tax=Pollicipes pollicipes TaxID=41117 RepID=UPI0018859963|nr:protein FAM214A-like [Pollicipes pollicipes]